MNHLPVTEAELHAYIDDRLPAPRRAEIDNYLAEHPAEAERVASYRAQNGAIRATFDPILHEAIPHRLHPPAANDASWLQRWLPQIAAAFVIAIVSGGSGWMLHTPPVTTPDLAQHFKVPALQADTPNAFAHQAAIAHVVYSPEVTRPVEIGAEQEDQLVTWLSKRLGSKINPPKLGKLGYELIGGRLLPGQSGPVAQFMYHNVAGQRLTVYVSTDQTQNKDTGFRFAQEGPVNVFYWIDGKFGYALSAGIDKGELARIASAVYEQLQKPS